MRLLPALHAELRDHAARSKSRSGRELVFGTGFGTAQTATNVRRRVLAPAVREADERLVKRGVDPLPENLTPHSLRRTFASLHVALGTDPAALKRQMGHTSANLTMSVYADAMDWADGEREKLRALVDGGAAVPARFGAEQPADTAEPTMQVAP